MNIRDELSREHSKRMADTVAAYVIQHPSKLDELMECFFDPDIRTCQRAAWPVCKLGIKAPAMLHRYLPQMISNLASAGHDAVIRNTVRVWSEMQIEEQYEGSIFDLCMGYLCDPKMPVAVRAFSISVAGNIAQKYEALSRELVLELKHQLHSETKPAVLVRIRRYLKILQPEKK